MLIKSLAADDKFYRYAVVELSYDELRCLANSLYTLSTVQDTEKDSDFNAVRKSITEVFALVKHGHIPDFELKQMHDLLDKSKV